MACRGILCYLSITVVLIMPCCAAAEDQAQKTSPTAIVPTNTESLQRAIDAAYLAGQKKIVISPGVYPMDDRLRLRNLSDFEIDATGVTFARAEPTKTGISFDGCTDVTLRGLTLRCDKAPHTQGTIEAIDPDGTWIDLRVDAGYPADYLNQKTTGYCFDRKTRQWKAGTFDYGIASTEPRDGGLVRLHLDGHLGRNNQMLPGDLMGFRGPGGSDIAVFGCAKMKIIGVTLLGGTGFCMHESGGEGANYYSYRLTYCPRPPGAITDPLIASNADAFHSSGIRHGPTLENCSFEGMCDDGVPIHGEYAMVASSGTKELIIAGPGDRNFFRNGDPVRLLDTGAGYVGEAKVINSQLAAGFHPAEPLKDKKFVRCHRFYQLTLDHDLPAKPGDRVSDPNANGSGFVVRHCTIRNHRARGMLIKADDGLIEDNRIEGSTIADLVISPEYYWNEADYSRHLVIRNNFFGRCGYAITGPWNQQAGAVTLASEAKKRGPGGYGHQQITIENNTFEEIDGVNLFINSAQNVLVEGNRFLRPQQQPTRRGADYMDPEALIYLSDCDDVRFERNTVSAAGAYSKHTVEAAPTATNVAGERGGVSPIPSH